MVRKSIIQKIVSIGLLLVYGNIFCTLSKGLAAPSVSMRNSSRIFRTHSLDGAQTVCSIAQDSTGMMWIGTERGLFCYDGYRSYRQYLPNHVSNTQVYAVAIHNGVAYLGTGNGILRFDLRTNAYLPQSGSADRLQEARALNSASPTTAYGNEVYSLLPTDKGLLIGALDGLWMQNAEGKRRIALKAGSQPLVNAMLYDNVRRCYWIGTEGALYRADLLLAHFDRVEALDGNSVKCFAEEGNGTLHVGTDNGLYSIGLSGRIDLAMHDSRDGSSIPNNIVWSCFVDKWQNVWIGTDNGLSSLSTQSYYSWTPLYAISQTDEGNLLHSILIDRAGGWWLGGTNGLLHFLTNAAGYKDAVWYKQNSTDHPITHNRVRKIYEDHDGGVWICTDHGINLYDRVSGRMRNLIVYDKTGRYSTAWAYDILEDKLGRMWIAAYNGGVFIVDKKRLKASAGSLVADSHISSGKDGLSCLHVGQILLTGQGKVWASTYNGLDCIDMRTLRVENMMRDSSITFMLADHDDNVWTGGNGVVSLYATNGTRREWKVFGNVSTMCEVEGKNSREGSRLWVVCGGVCCVINPSTAATAQSSSILFSLPLIEPQTAFFSSTTRQVVLGGNDGFVSMAADIETYSRPSRLMLTGVVVNGHQTLPSLNEYEDKAAGGLPQQLEQLRLQSNENSFMLQLTDLPFAGKISAVYAYRLEGIDKEWKMISGNSSERSQKPLDIAYNGLPYGSYHLSVRLITAQEYAKTAFDGIGDEVYSLDIKVLPPWYLSVWAKMVYCIAFVLLMLGAMKFYIVRKRLQVERAQKAEIQEQAANRMRFFERLSQDMKTPLAQLMNVLFGFQASLEAKESKDLRAMRKASVEMSGLICRSIDMMNSRVGERRSSTAPVDVVELCRSIFNETMNETGEATSGAAFAMQSNVDHAMMSVDVMKWQPMVSILLRYVAKVNAGGGKCLLMLSTDNNVSSTLTLTFQGAIRLVDDQTGTMQLWSNPMHELYLAKEYAESQSGAIALNGEGNAIVVVFPLMLPGNKDSDAETSIKRTAVNDQADERLLAKITEIIEANMIDSEFNVSVLQEKVGIGSKQLYRKIKSLTDRTPVEYIRDIRMRKAALLLGEGKFTVSEVMYTVGFTSSSYFSKCFQKTFGVTPTKYIHPEQ